MQTQNPDQYAAEDPGQYQADDLDQQQGADPDQYAAEDPGQYQAEDPNQYYQIPNQNHYYQGPNPNRYYQPPNPNQYYYQQQQPQRKKFGLHTKASTFLFGVIFVVLSLIEMALFSAGVLGQQTIDASINYAGTAATIKFTKLWSMYIDVATASQLLLDPFASMPALGLSPLAIAIIVIAAAAFIDLIVFAIIWSRDPFFVNMPAKQGALSVSMIVSALFFSVFLILCAVAMIPPDIMTATTDLGMVFTINIPSTGAALYQIVRSAFGLFFASFGLLIFFGSGVWLILFNCVDFASSKQAYQYQRY